MNNEHSFVCTDHSGHDRYTSSRSREHTRTSDAAHTKFISNAADNQT